MKLKKLLSDLPFTLYKGRKDPEISGLATHSKRVTPNNLFIAKNGGAQFIGEAVAAGAAAVVTDLYDPFLKETIQVIHPAPGRLEALLAARYYGDPSKELFTIGVTGTNGKTSVTHLIRHLFEQAAIRCGVIGTIGYHIGEQRLDAPLTTPEIATSQKLLRKMVEQQCGAVAMEVSSIGIEQGRVEGITFDLAIFTNLSQDHLDYHQTMEVYAAQKAQLFKQLSPSSYALINRDSPHHQMMIEGCKAQCMTYGLTPGADLHAHEIVLSPAGSDFTLSYQGESSSFHLPLIGRHNIYNALAAIGAALLKGLSSEMIPTYLATFPPLPGRLERVANRANLQIFVDYAHTPDALEQVLKALREIKGAGRLLLVFGCGGERDREKRPIMGAVAERYSDLSIVTSDNPRGEDPAQICAETAAGFTTKEPLICLDRREAIERAIGEAHPDDLILIAGKGHETYQLFAHQTLPFDDQKVAQEIANR